MDSFTWVHENRRAKNRDRKTDSECGICENEAEAHCSVCVTLIFTKFLEVVEIQVLAKFHQAKCSGSRVIPFTEKRRKKLGDYRYAESNTVVVATAGSNYSEHEVE